LILFFLGVGFLVCAWGWAFCSCCVFATLPVVSRVRLIFSCACFVLDVLLWPPVLLRCMAIFGGDDVLQATLMLCRMFVEWLSAECGGAQQQQAATLVCTLPCYFPALASGAPSFTSAVQFISPALIMCMLHAARCAFSMHACASFVIFDSLDMPLFVLSFQLCCHHQHPPPCLLSVVPVIAYLHPSWRSIPAEWAALQPLHTTTTSCTSSFLPSASST